MPKCNGCGVIFWLSDLKEGFCRECERANHLEMKDAVGKCNECGVEFNLKSLDSDGVCKECMASKLILSDEKKQQIKSIPFFTTEEVALSTVLKTLGVARGSTVRSKHIGRDIMADVKGIVGGELKGYTELLAEGREEAIYRMKCDAEKLGANAVICVRFSTSTISAGAAEILAYGTAVKIKKN